MADRGNRRIQVFTLEGKYLKQVFINRNEFEWRCDPSAPWRSERIAPHDYDQRVINELAGHTTEALQIVENMRRDLENADTTQGGATP